jgi:hypothetical protein
LKIDGESFNSAVAFTVEVQFIGLSLKKVRLDCSPDWSGNGTKHNHPRTDSIFAASLSGAAQYQRSARGRLYPPRKIEQKVELLLR